MTDTTDTHNTPALRITARPAGGFRRAGIHHPPTPVHHPANTFTTDQVSALEADNNLIVERLPDEPAKAPGGKR